MNHFDKKANSFLDGVTGLGVSLYALNTLAQNPVSAGDVMSLGTSLQETNNTHSNNLYEIDPPDIGRSGVPQFENNIQRGI